jgi:hypothetical protein
MKSHTPVVSQSRAAGTALPLPFLPHLTSPLAGKTEKLHQAHTRLQFPRRRALAKSACVDFADSIRQRLLSVHMVGAAAVVPQAWSHCGQKDQASALSAGTVETVR